MDPQEFFATLPRGKEDKPLLFGFGPLEYSRTDIDGLYYMLDRDFSGCLLLNFAKPMDDSVKGSATLDGEPLPPCVLKQLPFMNGLWSLGVPLRGYVSEYGKTYTLHVEGFVDQDGNEMNPQDFPVKCSDRVYPQEKDAAHEAVAMQAAQDGIVLLKNADHLLPLSEGTTLNVFGKAVCEFRTAAVGAGKINPRYTVDLLEAAREDGSLVLNEELAKFYRCDRDILPPQEMLEDARQKSDLAVMIITRGTGENMDNSTAKGEYYLSDDEDALLKSLTEIFPHVAVILNVGYPIDVRFAETYGVEALVYSGLGGMLGGKALVDILTGKVCPSGKLPDTWPKDYFDLPASRNFYDSVDKPRLTTECDVYMDTAYEEGLYVGYRYFTSFDKAPAYPFGFGLSYTTFDVAPGEVHWDGSTCSVDVTVKNTGTTAGREVVQLYVRKPGTQENPERELAAFEKTTLLQPGESQLLTLAVEKRVLSLYDTDAAAWIIPAGAYQVFVGTDSNAPETGCFQTEKTIVKQVGHLMLPVKAPNELTQKDNIWPKGLESGPKDGVTAFEPRSLRKKYPAKFDGKKPDHKLLYSDVKEEPSLAADFVAQMSVEELARLSVCASAGWGMEGVGEAGRIFKVEGYDLPDFPVSDGNSGVNLRITNIGMPTGVTMCATFDKNLIEQIGRVIGEEARALGMPMILAPGMNLHRNPLNGRQPEYFSEDPYLAGIMAGYYCKGMESAGVGSCIKHMVANNCESTRKRNMSIIGERVLRELYLRPFEYAMSVHMPASIMTAYNACNGQPTSADEELLMGFLREENGFDGFTMTDWGTYDTVDVAEMIQAGMCWVTPGSLDDTYTSQIVKGVQEGRIELARLQENVLWIIKTLIRFA